MNTDWLEDGRKIPDDAMWYIRVMAVNAIRGLGQSPEVIAKAYNFNRACIYRWLRQYDQGGFDALQSDMAPGASPLITGEMEEWLVHVVLRHTPVDFEYDTHLWTCAILAELLEMEYGVAVSDSAIRLHLKKLGLTPQKPSYRDIGRDEREIEYFLDIKFPRIQRLATKLGADIGFQDEGGVGVTTRYGRTWGLPGHTPIIPASMARGGYNVISVVAAQGRMRYSIKDSTVNGEVFVGFLRQIIHGRERPLILLVDHAKFHSSKPVRDFVRDHRSKLRVFFLPRRAPEMNPDEQVWNEIKTHRIGHQPVKNKKDLKERLVSALRSLQKNTNRIISFFQLPDTRYASLLPQCES